MKQVNRAKNIKVSVLTNGAIATLISSYDTFRTNNPNVVIPEGGIKILQNLPAYVQSNGRLVVGFSAASQAALITAYNDWKTSNPSTIVLNEMYAIDATAGAVTFNMIVTYIVNSGSISSSQVQGLVEYFVNDDAEQK